MRARREVALGLLLGWRNPLRLGSVTRARTRPRTGRNARTGCGAGESHCRGRRVAVTNRGPRGVLVIVRLRRVRHGRL